VGYAWNMEPQKKKFMPYVVLIVAIVAFLNSRFMERVSSKKVCAKFKEANRSGEIINSQ